MDDEDIDLPNFKYSKEELEYRALEKARRLFHYECEASRVEEPDTFDWILDDYIRVGTNFKEEFKDICMNRYNMSLQDMQSATSDNTDEEAMWYVIQWRRWANFVNSITVK